MRSFSDAISAADVATTEFEGAQLQSESDSAGASDSAVLLLGKSIADATGVTDAYALTVATVFADSAGITDSVSTVAVLLEHLMTRSTLSTLYHRAGQNKDSLPTQRL